jgi:PhnB protein
MKTIYRKDTANKKMFVTREFSAPLEQVWKAWTESKFLDQWWAPKPFQAKTKKMEFKDGGEWLYAMEGPGGERHWAKAKYKNIASGKSFEASDAFCDENGVETDFPAMHWKTAFNANGKVTTVEIEITYPSVEAMEQIIQMGFQEGFVAAHENLDALLASMEK